MKRAPAGLGSAGQALWRSIVSSHELDAAELALLTEACRAKDRLDKLDRLARGELEAWRPLLVGLPAGSSVVVDSLLTAEIRTADLLKQLLANLRLPDKSGRRPRRRGARRGVYVLGGR